MSRTAFVFPGQGAYLPGLLAGFPETHPVVVPVLGEIDGVCAEFGVRPVSELLLDMDAPDLETLLERSPEALHLSIFAASLAAAAVCDDEGVRPDVLVGHSFGEWAALTVAGVWTPAEAARLICERDRICRRSAIPAGGLLAVDAGPGRARHLAAAVDDWSLSVAVVNGPTQCVLAGPDPELAQAVRVVEALGRRAFRIRAAYPYHSRWMRPAADRFRPVAEAAPARPPQQRVYSPIAGRYLETVADLRRVAADHMVEPVDFRAALYALEADGVDVFVECGAKDIVTRLAAQTLRAPVTVAPLTRRALPDEAREALRALAAPPGQPPSPRAVPPGRNAADPPPAPPTAGEDAAQPQAQDVPAEEAPTAPRTSGTATDPNGLPDRATLIAELRAVYAERLGYPPDVVTEDADLEADLGVDSLRQTEMISYVHQRYGVPRPTADGPGGARSLAGVADRMLALTAAGQRT